MAVDTVKIVNDVREYRGNDNSSHGSGYHHSTTDNDDRDNIHKFAIETSCVNVDVSPLLRPCYLCHDTSFELEGKVLEPGLYYHNVVNSDSGAKNIDIYVCAPITIEASTCTDANDNFGRFLVFKDTNNLLHRWAMPMQMLKGSGEELLGELLNQGLVYNRRHKNLLLDFIMNYKPSAILLATNKIGWHENMFVLPDRVIGGDGIVFQSEHAFDSDFKISGSVESWKNSIGKYCEGNIPLMVSVAAALAGPLLGKLSILKGGGIHWVGDSSGGKSTSIEIAASIFGSPQFLRSWSATVNGLEGIASIRNDTCLILDEIDEALAKDIGKIIYLLANGLGKQRSGRAGNARKINRWRTIVLSTGERTLSNIMNEVQQTANAGQLVRMLNVEIKFRYGAFDNLHGFATGRELSEHLKAQRQIHYGTIGPAFIEKLILDNRNFSELFDNILTKFQCLANNNLEHRVLSFLAVIALAGELGIEYGLLPWAQDSVIDAVIDTLLLWRLGTESGQTEDERIVAMVKAYIDKYSGSRFCPKNEKDSKMQIISGWYEDSINGRTYLLLPEALTDAVSRSTRHRIVAALKNIGCIVDHDTKRLTKKTWVGVGYKYLYHIQIPEEDKEI